MRSGYNYCKIWIRYKVTRIREYEFEVEIAVFRYSVSRVPNVPSFLRLSPFYPCTPSLHIPKISSLLRSPCDLFSIELMKSKCWWVWPVGLLYRSNYWVQQLSSSDSIIILKILKYLLFIILQDLPIRNKKKLKPQWISVEEKELPCNFPPCIPKLIFFNKPSTRYLCSWRF